MIFTIVLITLTWFIGATFLGLLIGQMIQRAESSAEFKSTQEIQ